MDLPPVVQRVLSPAASEALQAFGVISLADFGHLSATDLLEITADEATLQCITSAWRVALVQCKAAEQRPPAACVPMAPLPAVPSVAALLTTRPKARLFPPAAIAPRPFRHVISQAIPAAGASGKTSDRRADCLDAMFQVAVQVGSNNCAFGRELGMRQDEAKPLFFRKFQAVSDERLVALRSALRRWYKWHSQHAPRDQPFWQPSALTLSSYFQAVSRGGPTAASAAFAALKFWRDKVGLPFCLDDALVSHWAAPAQGHKAVGRDPIPLCIFLCLCKAATAATGSVRTFMCHALLTLVACLRFRHLQCSFRLHIDSGFLRGTCKKGKRRVQQTRPPFDWACPSQLPFGLDLAQQILLDYGELQTAMGDSADFVVTDYNLRSGEALTASTKRCFRPMGLPRFCELLRSLLLTLGIPPDAVGSFTSYSLRRFLPTCADSLQMPEESKVAIGDWQEKPQLVAAPKHRAAPNSMAVRYAHDRVLAAGFVKLQVVVCVDAVCSKCGMDITWNDRRMNAPSADETAELVRAERWHGYAAKPRPVPAKADSSSSSASSTSGDSDDEESEAELAAWFRQSSRGALHLVQGMSGPRFIPYCQDVPFEGPHVERGSGLEASDNVCRKCLARAPDYVKQFRGG
ncbi:unnamed protein product [Symbiodinium sp. CCMP2456]|nr:unnamed protein product [Symbiodinium sp. CCMP2456]